MIRRITNKEALLLFQSLDKEEPEQVQRVMSRGAWKKVHLALGVTQKKKDDWKHQIIHLLTPHMLIFKV